MSDQNRAEKIEKVLNAIQWAGAIPGPQKLYLQLLLGQAGMSR